jgi:hypothetical protein
LKFSAEILDKYSKHLKIRQFWLSNGQSQPKLVILIPDHFWPQSCCNHLKTTPEIENPFHFWSGWDHFIAKKLTICNQTIRKSNHLNTRTKNVQFIWTSGYDIQVLIVSYI